MAGCDFDPLDEQAVDLIGQSEEDVQSLLLSLTRLLRGDVGAMDDETSLGELALDISQLMPLLLDPLQDVVLRLEDVVQPEKVVKHNAI